MDADQKTNLAIDIHHLTRVEGHGNIVVNVKDGVLEQCNLEIVEAPRFFEAMLRGRPYDQASHLTSRICGICAVTHATASLRATENALGVALTDQTLLLRKLMLDAEMLDSHILHAYMLVAPDLLKVGSVIPLAKTAPEVVLRALRMKKLAGDICTTVAGRHTHPVAMTVGGFTHFPKASELELLAERLDQMAADIEATVELFQSLPLPEFERETEFIALHKPGEYCLLDGEIASSDGGTWPIESYRSVTNEHLVDHSTAKHTRHQRDSYMVGALARFNLNYDQLHPKAKAAAAALDIKPVCYNPYMNTVAQVVEIAHCTQHALDTIQELLDRGIAHEAPAPTSHMTGEGVGACEAPRGILFHNYRVEDGLVQGANCIIPTNQNLANIEADMRALVPQRLMESEQDLTMSLEMLVRAYDPCISCSTHVLDVKFA